METSIQSHILPLKLSPVLTLGLVKNAINTNVTIVFIWLKDSACPFLE